MPPLEIRTFKDSDHAAALRLWQETEGVGVSEADSFAGIQQFLTRNPSLSLVASAEDELVATILCGHDGRRGFIHHLVVAPAHRRRGLAKELVRRCLAALSTQGIAKCHLFVFRENVVGRVFWERLGGEERNALVMVSFPTEEWANQALEPKPTSVTDRAAHAPRQP